MHGVHTDLGEQAPLGVEEVAHITVRAQPDHGQQLDAPDPGADQGGEFVGDGVGEGARISSRTPSDTGNFRCQPASDPPVRRRRVIEDATRRSSAVS